MTRLCCCNDGITAVEGTLHYHELIKATGKHGGNAETSTEGNKGSAI